MSRNHSNRPLDLQLAGAAFCLLALLFLPACGHHKATTASNAKGSQEYKEAALSYQIGDTGSAIAELNVAIAENPELTEAHVLLGDIYKNKGDFNSATPQYQVAVKLEPDDYKNHYNLGVAYQFLDRLQDAAASYLRALQLKSTDLNSNMNLGLVYLAINQPDDAMACMQKAVQIDPNSSAAHCNLGVILDARGDLTGAEQEYRRAYELDSKSPVTLMNLAGNLIRQQRGKEAVAVMRDCIKLSDTTQGRKRYGDALVLDGRDDDAYRQYSEALRRNPNYWQALNQVGLIQIRKYVASTQLDEAVRQQAVATWRRSMDLNPSQPALQELITKWDHPDAAFP